MKKRKIRLRRGWSIKPSTRVIEDKKKKYNRQKLKVELKKQI
jgi:hypothetical protein